MKIAFLIQAHEDEEHLQRLVNTLGGHDVFIHWDAKSGEQPKIENAIFTDKRISVFWAGFSQVEATIELVKTALNTGENYIKIVLISGSCYPIKPISNLVKLFENDNEKNYLNAIKVEDADFLKIQVAKKIWRDNVLPLSIVRTSHVKEIERIARAIYNKILGGVPKKSIDLDIYHGSSWWALNQETLKYVLKVYETRKDIIDFFKFTFASDEKFFHTIVRNSEYERYCSHYSEYTGRGTYKMANLHIIHPSLAKWYDLSDYAEISESDKFFVRKVNSKFSLELLTEINCSLLQ